MNSAETIMSTKNFGVFLVVIVVLAMFLVIGVLLFRSEPTTWYGYVVGDDRKIYMINLESGELEWVSKEFEEIGNPTAIEISREESILYIASGPEARMINGMTIRPSRDYAPLIAVK